MKARKSETMRRDSRLTKDDLSTQGSTTAATLEPLSCSQSNRTESGGRGAVWGARCCFLLTLAAVAASFGGISFYLLRESENELTEVHFASITNQGRTIAREKLERKRVGLKTLASVIGGANPDPSKWPFVVLNNYENIAKNLIVVSNGCPIGFAPLVKPSDVDSFEDYIYDFYEQSRLPEPFPNGTAVQPFGKGIWSDDSSNEPFHDVTGRSWWGGNRTILAPLVHHSDGDVPQLLKNLHADPTKGRMIEDMIQCAQEKVAVGESMDECVVLSLTSSVDPSAENPSERIPCVTMMQPVYPSNDPSKVVGFIETDLAWEELLVLAFADAVSGLDIVIQSSRGPGYTFRIVDGVPHLAGEGDLHEDSLDSHGVQIELTRPSLFGPASNHVTLSVYPGQELYEVYRTDNPRFAALGAVGIIFFTSLMFMCFDYFVRRESQAQQSLLDAKRKFVRFVSHEVRTPLNSVGMGLTLLKHEITAMLHHRGSSSSSSPPSSRLDKGLEKICRSWLSLAEEISVNSKTAVDVLNDFLNYDKVESGDLSLDNSIVPIFALVEQTVIEFKLPAANKKILVVVRTPVSTSSYPDGPDAAEVEESEQYVVGDKVRLTQVIRNLISNAIKFTPEGGSITVEAEWIPHMNRSSEAISKPLNPPKTFALGNEKILSCQRSRGSVRVAVKDSGVGMTPRQVQTVFDQGTQFNVNELQAGNGSGLGTYIAKGIVKQHGGKLSASSDGLHQGSTFSVSLPVYEIPIEHLISAAYADSMARLQLSSSSVQEETIGPLKILVVDDAPMNVKLLRRLLERQGHTTEGAEDGQIAVTMVQESLQQHEPYDVILTDYQMPNMDGPTAAQEIRRLGCDSFIVGVTGNLMPEDIRYFKDMGANAVIAKPVSLSDLEAVLMEHVLRTSNEQARLDAITASVRYEMTFSSAMDASLRISSGGANGSTSSLMDTSRRIGNGSPMDTSLRIGGNDTPEVAT